MRRYLTLHEVTTAYERGWAQIKNGELLDAAETDGFASLVTTDTNLKYQQNLSSRRIAIIVLSTTSWPRIQRAIHMVVAAVNVATNGSYTEVDKSLCQWSARAVSRATWIGLLHSRGKTHHRGLEAGRLNHPPCAPLRA